LGRRGIFPTRDLLRGSEEFSYQSAKLNLKYISVSSEQGRSAAIIVVKDGYSLRLSHSVDNEVKKKGLSTGGQ